MHGKSGTVMILNLSPVSEKEAENERLRQIARHSEKITAPKSHDCPSDMSFVRDLDAVLYDNMDDESESTLFNQEQMPRFARAMGASDDEIASLQAQFAQEDAEEGLEPASLSSFKQDYADYQKFGGDTVSMELVRDESPEEMGVAEMDDILGVAMGSAPMGAMESDIDRATAAMEEQFGRDALSVLEGESDGYVSFSVDTPNMGRVRYVYDSRTGEGRVMRGE